jgi:uncharacterized membrane protein YkoI
MKTNSRYMALALLGSAMLFTARAEKVRIEEVPVDLRAKIQAFSGSNRIEDIDRTTRDGKTTYAVAFKENGVHKELLFNEQGELLNQDRTPALDSRKISFEELPEAVKHIVQTRTQGAMVNDIDRRVKDGQITYEVGFKHNNQQHELLVSQEGRILRDVLIPGVAGVGAPAAGTSGTGKSVIQGGTATQALQLSNKEKLQFSQLPFEAAKAITTAAGGARIEDIEVGTWRGQRIYEAGFKHNGQHLEVQVKENGDLVHDPRKQNAGAPAAGVYGASSQYPDVQAMVQLSSSEKVERNAVPAAVDRAITIHAGANRIEDIERGTWRGMKVYQIAFKDEGQHVELQVDEQGNVIFDPREKQ